jgi:hypothetical protein
MYGHDEWPTALGEFRELKLRVHTILAVAISTALAMSAAGFVEPVAPALGASSSCGTPGKDGAVTYTSGVPNTYYAGSGTLAAGATSVTLGALNATGSSTAFTAGDLALIIEMQGATINTTQGTAYGSGGTSSNGATAITAGKYEYVAVRAVSGSTLTVASANGGGLINSYTEAAAMSTAGAKSFQIIRVPQYKSFTFGSGDNLYTAPWNGSSGGVIALDVVGTLTLAANINADGYGFRGGGQNPWGNGYGGTEATTTAQKTPSGASDADWGYSVGSGNTNITTALAYGSYNGGPDGFKGEGIAGTPIWTYTSGASAPAFSPSTATYASDGVSAGYPGGSKSKGAPGNAGGGAMDGDPNGYGPVGFNPSGQAFNQYNAGGGGGANGGAGGLGGENWAGVTNTTADGSTLTQGFGGAAFTNSVTTVIMGGGGGAGSNNDGSYGTHVIDVGGGQTFTPTATTASSGGEGGGIVMLRVGSITAGTISAQGISAPDPDNDGGGGGGGGGTVILTATTSIAGGVAINVSGGAGASATGGNGGTSQYDGTGTLYPHGPGGGGGGGAVLFSSAAGTPTVTDAGGASGLTTGNKVAYGATAGGAGTSVSAGVTPAAVPGARSGAECELLLVAKRYTSLNGTAQTGYTADGFTDPVSGEVIDANPYWPLSGGNPAIIGATSITSKPSDKIEYSIYYLSAGGTGITNGIICDYVPPDQAIVAAYNGNTSTMEVVSGFTSPTTTYYGTVTTGSGVYAVNTATGSGAPAACGTAPKSTVTGKYSSAAVYYNAGAIAPYATTNSGYGRVVFTAQTF